MTYTYLSFNKKAFCTFIIALSIVAGAPVNPIVHGIDVLNKSELATVIHEEVQKDPDALWIATNNVYAQYLIANGANTLNGVNRYPNFKWLEQIDPEKKYSDVYNRYAHILVKLGDKINFDLQSSDLYEVTLTYDALKKLGIKYCFMHIEPDKETIEKFHLQSIYVNEINHHLYIIN